MSVEMINSRRSLHAFNQVYLSLEPLACRTVGAMIRCIVHEEGISVLWKSCKLFSTSSQCNLHRGRHDALFIATNNYIDRMWSMAKL